VAASEDCDFSRAVSKGSTFGTEYELGGRGLSGAGSCCGAERGTTRRGVWSFSETCDASRSGTTDGTVLSLARCST